MVDKEIPEETPDYFIYLIIGLILLAILFVIWFFNYMRGTTPLS
jgi:hypothetical protein